MAGRVQAAVGTLGLVLTAACAEQRAARPEVVVIVDTDLPLIGQMAALPELSFDAAIDALRVDVLSASGIAESLLVIEPDAARWPISFGVAGQAGARVRIRLRAFRSEWAQDGDVLGSPTLDPPALLSIDRLIEVELPDQGVNRRAVTLSGDCLGHPSDFQNGTSCIDSTRSTASATDGVESVDEAAPTRAATWAGAQFSACQGVAPPNAVCIPGGFAVLGDTALAGLTDGVVVFADAAPLRPVLLSAFWMDPTEVVVARYRDLLAQKPGALSEPPPEAFDATERPLCTLDSGDDAELPLNCIAQSSAQQICELLGGRLPSEAEWEYAARGRGQSRTYPWGETLASCCTSALGRGQSDDCPFTGPIEVQSFVGTGCNSADLSRDGVADLGGSLREYVRDTPAAYDGSYWGRAGVLRDPLYIDGTSGQVSTRGADWTEPFHFARAALRRTFLNGAGPNSIGFRCAYPGGNAK